MNTPVYDKCVAALGDPEKTLRYLRRRYAIYRAHRIVVTMNAALVRLGIV